MPLFTATDNLAILATLGDDRTIVIDDGTQQGLRIDGIYDGPFRRSLIAGGEVGIESFAPQLTVRTQDVAAVVAHETIVWVDGQSYIVTGIQPDGSGITVLILQEVE